MNWLVIAVIVLIVLATLAGAKRGLVKTVLSFASFFVSSIKVVSSFIFASSLLKSSISCLLFLLFN